MGKQCCRCRQFSVTKINDEISSEQINKNNGSYFQTLNVWYLRLEKNILYVLKDVRKEKLEYLSAKKVIFMKF